MVNYTTIQQDLYNVFFATLFVINCYHKREKRKSLAINLLIIVSFLSTQKQMPAPYITNMQ